MSAPRILLEGVPKVGFCAPDSSKAPENVPFPSSLASAMRYLGATGMAFGLLWRPGWHQDNVDMMFVADPRELIDRAFRASGYRYEIVPKTGVADVDEAALWELTGEPHPAYLRFADREVRRRTAALIGKARQLDERAAAYLEQALLQLPQ